MEQALNSVPTKLLLCKDGKYNNFFIYLKQYEHYLYKIRRENERGREMVVYDGSYFNLDKCLR